MARMKRFAWIALLSALALSVAACSGTAATTTTQTTAATTTTQTTAATTTTQTTAATTTTQAPVKPLAGKTITIVVPYNPGGGYDTDQRTLQPFLEDELGATIVIENQPGAGGLLALNNMLNQPADGTVFGTVFASGVVGALLTGDSAPQFGPDDLTIICRVAWDGQIVVTGATNPRQKIEDYIGSQDLVTFATEGPSSGSQLNAAFLGELLHMNYRIVPGFNGIGERLAVLATNDADLTSSTATREAPAIQAGEETGVVLIASERDALIPDVPTVLELNVDDSTKAVFEELVHFHQIGRLILGPPNMDPVAAEAIANAYQAVLANPEAQAAMAAANRSVSYLGMAETNDLWQSLLANPSAEFLRLVNIAYQG
jgi:tripartite-type tricarboxylate transporter receptor subunit TctC